MIQVAQERSQSYGNIDYRAVDVMKWLFPERRYDCVVSIATLHHLPLDAILYKMRESVRPGGVLLVLDLYRAEAASDFLVSAIAVLVNAVLSLVRTGRIRQRSELRAAWDEHGQHDIYPTLAEVRHVCHHLLPGARVRRHLLWRYSIIWRRTELGAQLIENPAGLPHPFIDHVRV